MTSEQNIKVAIRVRPFSERERARKAKLIIQMEDNVTMVVDPNHPQVPPKRFAFDYAYWSHDGFKKRSDGYFEPKKAIYVDQVRIFEDLGKGMLANAWDGFHCTLFAYGQTGSGKSYTIIGNDGNDGLVPRTCEELFKEIVKRRSKDRKFQVSLSMLEIYNEQVRDLLNTKNKPPGGLPVRENAVKGFYVEGLSVVPIGNQKEISSRMREGERERTIAATKVNENSSRAHTMVMINFVQNLVRQKTTKSSRINLVDLAGSERQKQSESTGDRFDEAKNINKSLLTLGSVIKALCDRSQKRQNTSHIPYRDSVLTKLLKDAVGGNSKTVMLAAISPDDVNYEQTVSTLRYADRAKSIRTQAMVNEQATDKLIKELIAEKERLLQELERTKSGSSFKGYSEEDIKRIREENQRELQRYREQMEDVETSWQKRLEEARKEMEEVLAREKQQEDNEKLMPHFFNLNEDYALTGKLKLFLKAGKLTIGNGKEGSRPEIVLNGPRIAKEHATVTHKKGGDVFLKPRHGLILHNGKELLTEIKLEHQDRVRFGSNNLFVFVHPIHATEMTKTGRIFNEITYDYAQSEIAKSAGLSFDQGDVLLQEDLLSMLQLVQDVNAMAEDLGKPVVFSIQLVAPDVWGADTGNTEIFILVNDQTNQNEYLWSKNKFLNRQIHMQQMYQTFVEMGVTPNVAKEKDPFWEPPDTKVIVGVATVPLNFLCHGLEFEQESVTIIDTHAKHCGYLSVAIIPCDAKGKELVNSHVDDPMDLVGKCLSFKICINKAMNLPERYPKTWCQYRFYQDSRYTVTENGGGKNPEYVHSKLYKFAEQAVDHKLMSYLQEKMLPIEVWGQQNDEPSKKKASSVAATPVPSTPPAPSAQSQAILEANKKLNGELEDSKKKIKMLETKVEASKGLNGQLEEANKKVKGLETKLSQIEKTVKAMPPGPQVTELKKILKKK